jgi:hypothetical protein
MFRAGSRLLGNYPGASGSTSYVAGYLEAQSDCHQFGLCRGPERRKEQ